MTFRELRHRIAADQHRYDAGTGWRDFMRHWLKESGFRFTVLMRLCAFLRSQRLTRYGVYHFFLWLHRRMQVRYGSYIEFSTQVGPGLYLGHPNSIVINTRSVIGANCTLSHGVTLGQTHERSKHPGVPVIGDRVYLGCGAKILGGIKIGNDAVVAPNAVVVSDVPAGAVVGGIPARVLSMEGSDGYVSNVWPFQPSGGSEKQPPSFQPPEC
jgi:serine O-acetyltransferase